MPSPVAARTRWAADHPHYRWIALSNTTLGMLILLVVSFGRLVDIYGRVRIYNGGFEAATLSPVRSSGPVQSPAASPGER